MKIFGTHDEKTLQQLRTVATRAEKVALMADGHVGYHFPIGGVAAYRDQVSVVGVGFDIACIPAGTPVTTRDGYHRPIERITPADGVVCWDGERIRPAVPHAGAIPRGVKPVLEVGLANGRTLRATADHRVRTREGWKPVGELGPSDVLACSPFVGLPHEPWDEEIPLALRDRWVEEEMATRGLYPLRGGSPLLPAVVRLLGYLSGDGHLSRDGKRVSFYLYAEEDAASVEADLRRIGYPPRVHRRTRREGGREEIHLYVGSVALHSFFAALDSPVGKKEWRERPMGWLSGAPAWVRAHFLSAFCSAEMTTPRVHPNGTIPNLQVKQSGRNPHAITFLAELFRSLGFGVSVAPSGKPAGERVISVLQLLGGQGAQVRFLAEVGFCYSASKRIAAAVASSVAWQGERYVHHRDAAKHEARALRGSGVGWREVVAEVSGRFGVSPGFVYHSIYDDRGPSRRLPGAATRPDTLGEICWVPVESVREGEPCPVYDVVTGDPAHSFLASGVVVHNCGNAAIRTDLHIKDLGRGEHEVVHNLNEIADEIAGTVSFGVGRKNRAGDAPVDDPLFEDAAWEAVPRKERGPLRDKARAQLGTVGSGNHYVDVFADETGTLWVGVHFGSRGFGHTVASGFLAMGQGRGWKERVPEQEVLLPLSAPMGHDYFALMNLAGRYAYAGREWVARKVVSILGGRELELVHNHHNFCIAGDQLVPTPDGPKRMDALLAGDLVYAFDGEHGLQQTRVRRQWCSGRKPVVTIRTRSRSIRVSGDHPLLTVEVGRAPHPERPWFDRRVGTYRWKRAEEIAPGDVLVCAERFYRTDEGVGTDRARLIGAFLGDGWVRHAGVTTSGYGVGLAIGGAAEEHTERYRALLESSLPGANWRNNAPGAYGLTASSLEVWTALHEMGVADYSHGKTVPQFAFSLPREEKLAILAGYFDSDGSVASGSTSNRGRGTIASVSEALVAGLRELAIGCGLQVTPVRADRRITNFGACTVYRCVLSTDSVSQLDLWHERKRLHARTTRHGKPAGLQASKVGYLPLPPGAFAQTVRSIEWTEPVSVYDLEVEHPSHSFVCEGIVVHNCWRETHEVGSGNDRHRAEVLVVRKGATPAFPGQMGFIGGSMGDDAVIVRGTPDADPETARAQREALFSTVHGAGRVMSRTEAAGKRRWKTGEILSPGKVTREMMQGWLEEKGVVLRGGGLDESPHVYRRLPEVLTAQGATIEVVHTLRPLVVVMAGADEFDPYKD